MPAPSNQTDSAALNAALDQEMVANFRQDYDRLAEILGVFSPETMAAGQTLQQIKITGSLNNSKTDAGLDATGKIPTLGSSSGSAYVEGDEVALSKYTASKVAVGTLTPKPYRKQTTAAGILKAGFEVAVLRTDRKMLSNVRNAVVSDFFTFLGNGTGTASGTGLQGALAKADAKLGDTLETNGDSANSIIHFVNRQDAADYLAKAEITLQNAFGLTYLESFLGVGNVFLTNKVASGTLYATPAENIHVYGVDFGTLSNAGLVYTTDSDGLIGVAHTPAYDHVSTDTNMLVGALFFPEVQDYIVKSTISAASEG